MRLDDLMIFVKIVETKSFTAASHAIALPKSTISRRLADLEKLLGVQLLHRTTRRLVLTEAGAAYYEHCVQVLATIEEANRRISEANELPQGILRITAPQLFGETYISPLLPEYMNAYPKVQVVVRLSQNKIDLVAEGIDIAIRIGALESSSLVAKKLTTGKNCYCVSPEYLRTHSRPESPSDLAMHACITIDSEGAATRWPFTTETGEFTVPIYARLRVNNFAMSYQAALAGLGVARIPTFACADDIARGRLVPILEEWNHLVSPVYVVYPSNLHLTKKVRFFVDLLHKRLGSTTR